MAKTTPFTSGPWTAGTVGPDDDGRPSAFVSTNDGTGIAEVYGPNTAADARLIAEAPRLYELAQIVAGIHMGDDDDVNHALPGAQGLAIALLGVIESQAEYDGYQERVRRTKR